MSRGTKIALAFLLVLFIGTGVYFTLNNTKPSSNGTDALATAPDALGNTGLTFPETIVLGPAPSNGTSIEVVAPPASTVVDIFDAPAIDPMAVPSVTPVVPDPFGSGASGAFPPVNPVAPVVPVQPTPEPVVATTASNYTVVSGDTLEGIATKVLGRGSAWSAIAAANPSVNPNALKIGTVLTMPSSEQLAMAGKSKSAPRAGTTRSTKPTSKSTTSRGRRYTVKTGDTLWKIAKAEYGTATKANVDKIREANDIGTDGTVKVGQAITIP